MLGHICMACEAYIAPFHGALLMEVMTALAVIVSGVRVHAGQRALVAAPAALLCRRPFRTVRAVAAPAFDLLRRVSVRHLRRMTVGAAFFDDTVVRPVACDTLLVASRQRLHFR